MFKKLRKAPGLIVSMAIILFLMYAIAYGQPFNKILGGNITPGDGLVKHADSIAFHILCGFPFYISFDSLKYDFTAATESLVGTWNTQTILGTKTFTSASGVILGADGQDGKLTIFSEQGVTDYSVVFVPHATMTQNTSYTLPTNDGDASQFLQTNGSGALIWATPSGSGDMLKSTYDVDVDGVVDSAETVSHGIISNLIHDTTAANWAAFIADDTLEHETISDIIGAHVTGNTETGITVTFEDGDNTLDFVVALGINIEDAEVDDNITVNESKDVDTTGTKISDALGNRASYSTIHDSLWKPVELIPKSVPSNWKTDDEPEDSIDVFYPVADGKHPSFCWVKNFSSQPAQECTLVFSFYATEDIDSVFYGLNTETTTSDTSSIAFVFLKQNRSGADTTRVYPTTHDAKYITSGTAGVWSYATMMSDSIGTVSRGQTLIVWMICKLNAHRELFGFVSPYSKDK